MHLVTGAAGFLGRLFVEHLAPSVPVRALVRPGARATVLRLPLVYGPGVKSHLRAIRLGVFQPLPHLPNRRSLASVDDVWNAALLARDVPAAAGRTYFVTDGRACSSREIYDAMRAALGLPERRWAIPLSVLLAAADAAIRLTGRAPLHG